MKKGTKSILTALAAPLAEAAIAAAAGYIGSRMGQPSATAATTAPRPPVLLSEWEKRHPQQASQIASAERRAKVAERQAVLADDKAERYKKKATKQIYTSGATVAAVVSVLVPALMANVPFLREVFVAMCNATGAG